MKIAVFYHAVLHSPIQDFGEQAMEILLEQLSSLKRSGLDSSATEVHIGINEEDTLLLASLCPEKSTIHSTGDGTQGEKPTMMLMQQWIPGHEDWLVCYHHMKGVAHSNDGYRGWRRCMQEAVIHQWNRCVSALQNGFDTVGAHWKTNLDQKYWAGNFWWATAKYLGTLPPLNPKTLNGRYYEGEVWIGKGNPRYHQIMNHPFLAGCQ